jgi:hypothetical protein
MGWMAGVQFLVMQDFSLLHSVQTDYGAHPASYPIGPGGSFPRSNVARARADHPPPSSAKVKNGGAITPLSHMPSWHGACLLHQMKLEIKRSHNASYTIRTKEHCNNTAHKRISPIQYHNSQPNVHNS